MLFARDVMERIGFWDAGDERKEIQAVVVWKMRWSLCCGSYGDGEAV